MSGTKLILSRRLATTLLAEARHVAPLECCGLLGGHGQRVTQVFPATNELASPVAYEIPPRELFELFRRLRAQQLDLVGIYHSHPTGDNYPSARDIERAYYPETAYLIVALEAPPKVGQPFRAFRIREGEVAELVVEIED